MYKIIFIFFIVIIIGVGIYFFLARENGNDIEKQKGEILYPLSQDTPIPQTIPTTDVITLQNTNGEVTMRNFLRNATPLGSNFLLFKNKDFSITYFRRGNAFLIGIDNEPIREVRTQAENTLIGILGIQQQEACKLFVTVALPNWLSPELAGKDYHLSFCPDGIPF